MTLLQAINASTRITLFFDEGYLVITKKQAKELRNRVAWMTSEEWDGAENRPNWNFKDGRLNMHWVSP